MSKLEAALAATQHGLGFNNRVPQPLNHRVVSSMGAPKPVKWLYAADGDAAASADVQGATWGGLCATGKEQSPIDVVSAEAVVPASMTAGYGVSGIETFFSAELAYVKNTGHGFQLFETHPATHGLDDGGAVEAAVDGEPKGYSMINGAKYNFYQVHWHTPSENTVDGQSFALEAHFVHQLADEGLHGTYHRLAVIGLLYELSEECNVFLDYFWDSFPEDKGVSAYEGQELDFNAKLAEELAEGYWHWYGSLTTPPCTEGVSWNLLKRTEPVCARQVLFF